MTKKEAMEIALRWLDEATVNGAAVRQETIADLENRMAYLLNGVVQFFAKQFPICAVYRVCQFQPKNLLGNGFEQKDFGYPYQFTAADKKAGSLFLEIFGKTDYFIYSGETLLRSQQTKEDSREEVRYTFANNDHNGLRIQVKSAFPFSVRNAAMYDCIYAKEENVPSYGAYQKYVLPADFLEFDTLYYSAAGDGLQKYGAFKMEGEKTFYLPSGVRGEFSFHYYKRPCTVPCSAEDGFELEIRKDVQELAPLKLAVDCAAAVPDLRTTGCLLEEKLSSMIASAGNVRIRGGAEIETVYQI